MAKSRKKDAALVAQFQPSEIQAVREAFAVKGVKLTAENVREAVRSVGHSKEKVYEYLQEKYGDG